MVSRRDVALRLDIPIEMANRHGLPKSMTEEEFAELDANPPPWLLQSRANRRAGGRPVWLQLTCTVCGFTEAVRPKKWWPTFAYVTCDFHDIGDVPPAAEGMYRSELDGIGSRFIAIVDEPA